MKIKVNGQPLHLFHGATTRDAALRHLVMQGQSPRRLPHLIIRDTLGHELGLDAPLREESEIIISNR